MERMNTLKKATGAAAAIAAATMLLAGCESMPGSTSSKANSADVHCYGVNACKGHTACATASNKCKGMGWMPMSASDCAAKGGTVKG